MAEHAASARTVARMAVVALAATGAVSALGGTAAADTDVYEVTTAQELRAALDSSDMCARPVVIEISGVIALDDSYAHVDPGDYTATPMVICGHTITFQGVTPDAALVSTGTERYGVIRHMADGSNVAGTTEVFDLRIADFETDIRGTIASAGDVVIARSVFENNTTVGGTGGAVRATANATVTDSAFIDNSASGTGGALHAESATVTGSTFTGNSADRGGAIDVDVALEVKDSKFFDNEATTSGGAIQVKGSLAVEDSVFEGNTAKHGGALEAASGAESTNVTRSSFVQNVADPEQVGLGGAIRTSAGTLTVEQSSFVSNEAFQGGAIYTSHGLDLSHSTLYTNVADAQGGAAYVNGGAELSFVTAVSNAQDYWGSFHIVQSTMTVEASVIAGSQHNQSPPRECHGVNPTITSGGYNVFGQHGCVNVLDATDQVRNFDENFGLEDIAEGAVGSHLVPVEDGPLYDAIPVDHPLCVGHAHDQNGDARPQGDGCDIGAAERFVELPYVATEAPFVDVPLSHPFVDEIAWLATTGVTTGYDDGTFRPTGVVTRQAMAAFLMRFAGVDDFDAPATATFADVPTTHVFFEEIEWLVDAGVTTGYDDGTFRGGAPVSRQAMAAFLMRFAGVDDVDAPATATFADVPTTHVFFEEIEWLVDAGVTTGYNDGTFRGGATVTRQATAAFLYRLYFDDRP